MKPGKLYSIASFMLLLYTVGCNESSEETVTALTQNSTTNIIDTIFAGDRDTIIILNNGEAIIKGRITAHKAQPKYTLPVWKGQKVTATLKPLIKGGNVRISQVQKPGGVSDGPFDDSVFCAIEDHGNLRFIIGENLMTRIPYTGYFIVHVKVK